MNYVLTDIDNIIIIILTGLPQDKMRAHQKRGCPPNVPVLSAEHDFVF